LAIIDNTTTAIFTAEIIMKMISFGVIFNGENSYLQSSSNTLDLLVTGLSIISAFLDNVNL
jgi:Ion transport protein